MERVGGSSSPLLLQNDIVELIRMEVLLACNEDDTFRCRQNERAAAFHPINSERFECVEEATVQ